MNSLNEHELACVETLKAIWEELEQYNKETQEWYQVERDYVFTDEIYLRFARCNRFQIESALEMMERLEHRYLNITCRAVERQLTKQVCFCLVMKYAKCCMRKHIFKTA